MTFSIRLTTEEKNLATSYAKIHDMTLAEAFKKALFERIEDEYDLAVARDAQREYEENGCKSRPIENLWQEIGL